MWAIKNFKKSKQDTTFVYFFQHSIHFNLTESSNGELKYCPIKNKNYAVHYITLGHLKYLKYYKPLGNWIAFRHLLGT